MTPEAGAVKGGEARDIPLHQHLIELGFPAFVASVPSGHVFLTPAAGGDVLGPFMDVKIIAALALPALRGRTVNQWLGSPVP